MSSYVERLLTINSEDNFEPIHKCPYSCLAKQTKLQAINFCVARVLGCEMLCKALKTCHHNFSGTNGWLMPVETSQRIVPLWSGRGTSLNRNPGKSLALGSQLVLARWPLQQNPHQQENEVH